MQILIGPSDTKHPQRKLLSHVDSERGSRIMLSLAKVASRFAPTTLIDEQGGKIVLGEDFETDIVLF